MFVARAPLCLLVALGLSACAEDDVATEVGFAAGDTTVIANKLTHPGHLHLRGDKLVFSTAHFVASGDPELDQQFAYWEGELWSKPLKTGKRKKIGDGGAVVASAQIGEDILVIDSGYDGVTRYPASGDRTDFYNDYSHFPNDGEESADLAGIAVSKDYVYVTRGGSEVMRMGLDGSDVVQFAKTWKTGWAESAQEIVATDVAIFWSSEKQGDTGSKYNLYRATPGGTVSKLATYDGRIRSLATDGTRVFIAIEQKGTSKGQIAVALASKNTKPKTLVADQAYPDHLVYDGALGLLFVEGSADLVSLVPTANLASTSPVEATELMSAPDASSLVLGPEHLFVAVDLADDTNEAKGEIWRKKRSALLPQ